ncbi:uncharacterized protein LOC121868687 [Homarus americanus]|uniref:Uncharacterized protein n=1 Tax=Homarus americanus TaxID=6706 RepID=A0A8J5K4R1_HOMAM|nr:uncharacterized protein LOC121868687 [Homarus americanus]KAG7167005.1 hypothetical protein Hamer_G005311 [Homarus americanus]
MKLQILLGVVMCVYTASAMPQTYEALGVLQPSTRDLGPYDNMVAATIDILPEIAQVFEQITSDPARSNNFDSGFVERVILAFLPISRKVMEAMAKAEGKSVQQEDLDRLARAEAIMPSILAFIEKLRTTDFYGIGEDFSGSAGSSGLGVSKGGSEPTAAATTRLTKTSKTNNLSASIVRMPNGGTHFINHPRSQQ